jgi:uncharacterized membrane protein
MKNFLQGKWLGHPLHTFLVHLPTGLWPAALVFDVLTTLGIGGNVLTRLSFYAIGLGLLSALLAIPTGLADWWDIKRDKPAWKIGLYHLGLNLIITVLWAVNFGLRLQSPADVVRVPDGLVVLSAAATALLFVSGYLGGQMAYEYGISVARVSKDKWRRIAEAGGANVAPE